jgi:hypothetical protein
MPVWGSGRPEPVSTGNGRVGNGVRGNLRVDVRWQQAQPAPAWQSLGASEPAGVAVGAPTRVTGAASAAEVAVLLDRYPPAVGAEAVNAPAVAELAPTKRSRWRNRRR